MFPRGNHKSIETKCCESSGECEDLLTVNQQCRCGTTLALTQKRIEEEIMNTRTLRQALLVITVAVIFGAGYRCHAQVYGPVQGARIPDYVSIGAGQRCPEWCWAASVEMVARSQGVNLPQELVVRKIYGPTLPCLPSGNIQNILAGIQGVYRRADGATVAIQARAFFGNQGYAVPLIQSIQTGRPFIFLTQTHAMVAVGVHWAEVFTNWGQPTGAVQILDIELIDPYFTFGAQEFNTFPINGYTANQISGAIEIQSIELTEPQDDPDSADDDCCRTSAASDRVDEFGCDMSD
jgi:hypothetical protein